MIGEVIGNFRVISQLGHGGMGEVFLAEQTSIGTQVAIKVLRRDISRHNDQVQRFFNEARAVSRIKHAGIVKIFDVGFHQQQAYLIMEYLEGQSLARRIRDAGRLPMHVIADLGKQIASVLASTHEAGITHRDLKPDNIFLVPDGELANGERAKVLDFGIAKLTGTLAAGVASTFGAMGTPAYMAPEQWGDASKVDWRADVYSLGCVVFEMACGRPPFVVGNLAEACAKHLTEAPPRARTIVAALPEVLDNLLDSMLAKSPAGRPQAVREIGRLLGSLGTAAVTLPLEPQRPALLPIASDIAIARERATEQPGDTTIPMAPPPVSLDDAITARTPAALDDAATARPSPRANSGELAVKNVRDAVAVPAPSVVVTTTLGNAASERRIAEPRRRSRRPYVYAAIGTATAGGVIAIAATGGGDKSTATLAPPARDAAIAHAEPDAGRIVLPVLDAGAPDAAVELAKFPGWSIPTPGVVLPFLHAWKPAEYHAWQTRARKQLVEDLAILQPCFAVIEARKQRFRIGFEVDLDNRNEMEARNADAGACWKQAVAKLRVLEFPPRCNNGCSSAATFEVVYTPVGMVDTSGPENPWVTVDGISVLARQVGIAEYTRFLDGLSPADQKTAEPLGNWELDGSNRPVTWVTYQQANRYCESIGAALPTNAEWTKLAAGAWGMDPAKAGVVGPMKEWTRDLDKDKFAKVRGGHSKMNPNDKRKAATEEPVKPSGLGSGAFAQEKLAKDQLAESTIGFRCVRPQR